MCKVYNPVGSLTTVKSHLLDNNIQDFKSVNELIAFRKSYPSVKQEIISNHQLLIEKERETLCDELVSLQDSINAKKNEVEEQLKLEIEELELSISSILSTNFNVFKKVIAHFKKKQIEFKVLLKKRTFNQDINYALKHLTNNYDVKDSRYQYIQSNFDDAVMDSALLKLSEHERRKKVIDHINNSIYGAIGEQKVVKELERLSDDYILINDFNYTFYPVIYNKQNDDRIKSIQIDHVLISRSGIFIIETKNWSQESMESLNLYSPVQQIKRTNFALYRLLNTNISNTKVRLNNHHWGDRKLPIRNLIVLIKNKPIEEFQHVKVLTLNELLGYVNFFQPCFSNNEVQSIANYLLSLQR